MKPDPEAQLVCVPREPTDAMVDAGHVHCRTSPSFSMHAAANAYKAMLAAAPSAGTYVPVPLLTVTRVLHIIYAYASLLPGKQLSPTSEIVRDELRSRLHPTQDGKETND